LQSALRHIAREDQIIVVPAAIPYAFRNPNPGVLEMIYIHLNRTFIAEWL
jgi:mannose-6-phosphate isomerase-like protein (cupin superfamily)